MDFSANTVRCANWRARLREKLHIDVGLPTEDLAKGHNSPWLTWRSLNRLRTDTLAVKNDGVNGNTIMEPQRVYVDWQQKPRHTCCNAHS